MFVSAPKPAPGRVTSLATTRSAFFLTILLRALCHEIDHLDGVLYIDRMIEDVSGRYRQVRKGE